MGPVAIGLGLGGQSGKLHVCSLDPIAHLDIALSLTPNADVAVEHQAIFVQLTLASSQNSFA